MEKKLPCGCSLPECAGHELTFIKDFLEAVQKELNSSKKIFIDVADLMEKDEEIPDDLHLQFGWHLQRMENLGNFLEKICDEVDPIANNSKEILKVLKNKNSEDKKPWYTKLF